MPYLDDEARAEAAYELCDQLWGLENPERDHPEEFRIARLEADMAIDCYLGRLLAGDENVARAVDVIGAALWPGTWPHNSKPKAFKRTQLVEALEGAMPYLLAWAIQRASEQAGRAFTADVVTARAVRAEAALPGMGE